MTNSDAAAIVTVGEIVDCALSQHRDVACRPSIEHDGRTWTLTLRFATDDLEVFTLANALQCMRDVAQLRGFAETYGFDPQLLSSLVARVVDELKK